MYKCIECDDDVLKGQRAILCERCDRWIHSSCTEEITDDLYDVHFKQGTKLTCLRYFCKECDDKVSEAIEKAITLEQDTTVLKKEMKEVQNQILDIQKTIKHTVDNKVTDILDEKRQIDMRKMNLIVYGLPEPEKDGGTDWSTTEKDKADKEQLYEIIKEDIGVDLNQTSGIIDTRRFGTPSPGKPRPLKIVFKDLDVKRNVLTNAKKLRNSDKPVCKTLYINPDLTEKQREADKKLRAEMWIERGKQRNVIIRKGQLVEVPHKVRYTRSTQ